MPQALLARPQIQVLATPQPIAQAFPPALNPYQLPQPLPHEHTVARPSPVAGLSQVFQDLAQTWAATSDSHQVGDQPPVTGTTVPWMGVERELRTYLKGDSEPELAHLLNGLDGARAARSVPTHRRGSQMGRSRASTRASSRISLTSTQFRDAIDEALRAQAQETAARAEQRDREMAAQIATQAEERERRLLQEQAKQMERLVRGAAREAANKASKDTAESFKEQQERSEVARRHHQVFTSPPLAHSPQLLPWRT